MISFDEFKKSDLSLFIFKNEKVIFESRSDTLKPLIEAVKNHKNELEGSTVFDKKIGKAGSLLLIYAKIKNAYGLLVTRTAIEKLKNADIDIYVESVVDCILNKDKTDLCPMEKLSKIYEDPEEFYKKVISL